ncbi:MAG TPA: MmcQ/YjbR family DNA-binding protein [Longimicrobiales bacterium]|nr:MmcQ/YjbR family DNA-binding protein [Longimicrobiales bacterium]
MRRTPKNRTDREVAKAIALQLPDVELGSHHGTMDIRVRNKIFATFPAQSKVVVLKCSPENLRLMTAQNPEIFSKAWGETWVQVALDEIDRPTLQQLLIDAWLLAAPPALRRMHEANLPNRVR